MMNGSLQAAGMRRSKAVFSGVLANDVPPGAVLPLGSR